MSGGIEEQECPSQQEFGGRQPPKLLGEEGAWGDREEKERPSQKEKEKNKKHDHNGWWFELYRHICVIAPREGKGKKKDFLAGWAGVRVRCGGVGVGAGWGRGWG